MDILFEVEPIDVFTHLSQDLLGNLYNLNLPSTDIDPQVLQAAKEDIKKLILVSSFDMAKVAQSIHSKNWDKDKVNCFVTLLENKKTELLYTTLMHHNSTFGESVTDFDWFLKLIYGTNELKTLRYPLLQLMLLTVTSTGEQKRRVYDINKHMIAKIISLLESVDEIQ